MGKHGNEDTPTDSGRGGDTDGDRGSKHGGEDVPPQSGDGQGSGQ